MVDADSSTEDAPVAACVHIQNSIAEQCPHLCFPYNIFCGIFKLCTSNTNGWILKIAQG